MATTCEDVRFEARDGVPLVGRFYRADEARGAVLIAPATGVLARFYAPFAEWLASDRHLHVFVFDYRGIGASLVGKLKDCDAHKHEWGLYDLPAALDTLEARAGGLPLYYVGHSAGGQLIGLLDNVGKITRIAQVAASSGYLPKLDPSLRVQAYVLMHVFMRISNALVGYAACKALGWGEDLPRHVARQWREWCSSPGYVANAFGHEVARHFYDDIRAPLLSLSFTDDKIATDWTVDDLLRLFPNAQIVKQRLAPASVGLKHVDHVGFFKRTSQHVWPLVADFLTTEGTERVSPRESARSSAR
jgi:predicted alpha/beta hydrolase